MADDQKPASSVQIKQIIRRKLRKLPEHEEQSLNIYPLMDVMTILLVFMIMQFAQESASIVQSDELQIPYSSSGAETEEALPITISRTEILVDDRSVLTLRNGLVDPSQKQGGGTGFLITRLHETLSLHRERLVLVAQRGGVTFDGAVQIIADKRTPFRTLSEVIYTLGQAQFERIHFVVLQGSSSE